MQYVKHLVRCILLENTTNLISGGITLRELPDYKIGAPIDVSDALEDPLNVDLRNHVWSMIQSSYDNQPGEGWYPTPNDLMKHNMNAFYVYDITGDGVANVFFAGWISQKSSYGKIKMVQSGSDGSSQSVAFYKKEIVRWIESGKAILEASGAPAAILMKSGVPPMDKETVEKYFPKPPKYFFGVHPDPTSRDAQNATKYGPNGEYNFWFGRRFMGEKDIVKMWWGII